MSRAYSHKMADCQVAAGPRPGGKDGPSHPRDSKLSMAERDVGVLPKLLHRHGYRTQLLQTPACLSVLLLEKQDWKSIAVQF